MGEFFRGWRRKVGCCALLLASAISCLWVRSLAYQDTLLVLSDHTWREIISSHGSASFSLAVQQKRSSGPSSAWVTRPISPEYRNVLQARRILKNAPSTVIYYAPIVIALTLLSAWLIVSKQPEPDSLLIVDENSLPTASEASVSKGVWFVFPVKGATIRVWLTSFNGLERIYVDNEVVSEMHCMGLRSSHKFTHGPTDYEVVIKSSFFPAMLIECSLLTAGKIADAYRLTNGPPLTLFSIVRLFLTLAAALLIGTSFIWAPAPWWMLLILWIVAYLVARHYSRKQQLTFVIERITQVAQVR